MTFFKPTSLLLSMLVFSCIVLAQPQIKGLYVNDAQSWMGDTLREKQILTYAQANQFNYLTLYGLHGLTWNAATHQAVAGFIHRAKDIYGIHQVGAAGENFNFFANRIIPYNVSRTNPKEKFDVLNYEFEFWIQSRITTTYAPVYLIPNGFTADTAGAFAFSHAQFKKIDSLCTRYGLTSEIYLGWPTRGQMQKIASVADRILLHAYRKNDIDVYQYSKARLEDIASVKTKCNVLPIFSSEPDFMAAYLSTNSINKPYSVYKDHYLSESGLIKSFIELKGFQWFVYSFMPNPYALQATISASSSVNICPGGSVTLSANPGASYLWLPGQQTTRSITVSDSGSYAVIVTNSFGSSASSAPVTVTVSNWNYSPVITSSAPLLLCQGNSLTLSCSQADTYHWSNGSTAQSITVNATGNYTVTARSGGCTGTSTAASVSVVSTPPAPQITAGSSLSICPGEAVTLTSTQAGGYLWSNGATTRSIIVSDTGNYWVRTYSAPYCFTQSVAKAVQKLTSPPTPVITYAGSLTLTSSNPSVVLKSPIANAYSWSNGATSRNITATTQGSYRVTVTGSNGCKATSAAVQVTANGCTPPPVPDITASGSTILLAGQSVTLTSSPAGGYLWSNGATTQSITVNTEGTYSVRAYSAGSCFSTSLGITVRVIQARRMAEAPAEPAPAALFPNPSDGIVTLRYYLEEAGDQLITIYDMSGRVVVSEVSHGHPGLNELTHDLSSLAHGVYYYSVAGNGREEKHRLVIQH
jgi:hypothetical protein